MTKCFQKGKQTEPIVNCDINCIVLESKPTFRSIKLQAYSFNVFNVNSAVSTLTKSLTKPACILIQISVAAILYIVFEGDNDADGDGIGVTLKQSLFTEDDV